MKLRYWGTSFEEDQETISAITMRCNKEKVSVSIEYVDVLTNVDRAREAQVSLTPLIDRVEPLPTLRLIAINGGAHSVVAKLLS